MTSRSINVEEVLGNPGATFATPDEVVSNPGLTRAVLRRHGGGKQRSTK